MSSQSHFFDASCFSSEAVFKFLIKELLLLWMSRFYLKVGDDLPRCELFGFCFWVVCVGITPLTACSFGFVWMHTFCVSAVFGFGKISCDSASWCTSIFPLPKKKLNAASSGPSFYALRELYASTRLCIWVVVVLLRVHRYLFLYGFECKAVCCLPAICFNQTIFKTVFSF